jgi:hypothetical protein
MRYVPAVPGQSAFEAWSFRQSLEEFTGDEPEVVKIKTPVLSGPLADGAKDGPPPP